MRKTPTISNSMVRRELFRHSFEAAEALGFEYSLMPKTPAILEPFKREIEAYRRAVKAGLPYKR
ncbi:MAG: hypothetical protein AABX17_04435 [Nanoarchaeota archaeon]